MVGRVARSGETAGMKRAEPWTTTLATACIVALACVTGAAKAQGQDLPQLAPLPPECRLPGTAVIGSSPLPNIAAALKSRKKITILAIGGTSASVRGPVSGGLYATVEGFLEATFKGLDVEIVHRGVSGELAFDAAERIKMEVALNQVDLVLWQAGTADALAHVPVTDFADALGEAIDWLKARKVDVIIVGLRYARGVVDDPHYQAIRKAMYDVARQRNIMRLSRYDAEQTLERIRQSRGARIDEAETSAATYACMAEYLARAIASGVFARDRANPPAAKDKAAP